MTERIAIGLGSNLGDRRVHLDEAVNALAAVGEVVAVSSYYETAPVGGPPQGDYLNAVVVLDTDLDPAGVLERLLEIERNRGRLREERWGPRTLDLDLLLYGNQAVEQPGLTVPHPRMTERRFVLEPLVEVWPEAALPDGTALAELLPRVADQELRPVE
jgi:2-amino-4-hydroxy-6-hydroxymethyldihydropteridine diphosphokinase